mgnify:CR=1 FL=1
MYRQDLDALKGIAIIAVVLFHLGLLKSGYLGVDAFFVINGFLVIPSIVKKIENKDFTFFSFLEKRIVRLLPLIVLASFLSLVLGVILMLPDDLENLSQSIVASNVMSQNILSAITTKNYWAVSNDFKPLMHLWYVGVLFEFYLIFPALMLVANKIANLLKQSGKKWMTYTLLLAAVVSLIMYLNPDVSTGNRFYFIQYRFFELCAGGVIGLIITKLNWGGQASRIASRVVSVLLIAIIFSSVYNILSGDTVHIRNVIGSTSPMTTGMPFSGMFSLLLTVLLTATFVAFKDNSSIIFRSKILIWLGSMSYSIFIWHQVLLAFYRYSISTEVTAGFVIVFLLVTLGISCLSYYFIEKKLPTSRKSLIGWCVAAFLLIIPSGWLYLHAGVIRDVPELEVTKDNVHRGMFAEYCDRIYSYKEYPAKDNGKINVLVEGISFGRDFGNVLLESDFKDSINLVYVYRWTECDNIPELVSKSDYVFTFTNKPDVPAEVWENLKDDAKIMGIGTKNFGACNGVVYRNRFKPDYLQLCIEMLDGYSELNEQWRAAWGDDNYVDMIAPVLVEENRVRVFTDDGKYISPDTGHLSQPGAQWYAKVLDWNKIWNKK